MENLRPPHAKLTSLLSILAVCACSYTVSAQTAWTGTTSVFWGTSTNWSNGIPTSSTDIVQTTTPTNATATINGALAAVANSLNYSAAAGALQITGAGTGSQLTLSGDLIKSGASSLTFRKESAGALNLFVNGNLSMTGGNVVLGSSSGSNYLSALTVSGTTSISTGNLQIGVAADYSLGELKVTGGTVYLNFRAASAGTRQATTTGLTGSGGIVEATSNATAGDSANLIVNVASGSVSSATSLRDGNASGSLLSVEKRGNGTQTLSGISTYTGSTTVTAGTLIISGTIASNVTVNGGKMEATAANALGGTSVIVNGGTMSVKATNVFNNATTMNLSGGALLASGAVSETVTGGLSLTNASILDFGASNASFTFGTLAINGSLAIYNWDAGLDHLFITSGTSTGTFGLSNISFYSGAGTGFLGTAAFTGTELTAVPEPQTVALFGFSLIATLMMIRRSARKSSSRR